MIKKTEWFQHKIGEEAKFPAPQCLLGKKVEVVGHDYYTDHIKGVVRFRVKYVEKPS